MPASPKQIALDRIKKGDTKAQIARDLGISTQTVIRWAKAAGLTPPAQDRSAGGKWLKGVSGNPQGRGVELIEAREFAQRNAKVALQKLQRHVDRLEKILDEGADPSIGQTATAAQLTRALQILAGPALAPEKSTVTVEHTGEVTHAHRVTVEPAVVGSALDLLRELGAIPAAPVPAAVDPAQPLPQAARRDDGPPR
jgi:transcriptional regulator with XRE-family HTH domain